MVIHNNYTTNNDSINDSNEKEKTPQSEIILEMIEKSGVYLFNHSLGGVYAQIPIKNHKEVVEVSEKGGLFMDWVSIQYRRTHRGIARSQSIKDAVNLLKAETRFIGATHEVYVRVAEHEGVIYIDMCNKDRQVIEITKDGWEIVNEAPVFFIRPSISLELPIPKRNGDIQELRKLINIKDEDDWKLIVGWVLSTFNPSGPFPFINIQGGEGSAKSTTTRTLRTIVDPSALDVRSIPNNEKDLAISTLNSWILAYDNLSGMSGKMSDEFCKLSTGGAITTRKLYSDTEEVALKMQRPAIFNGISDIAKKQDLLRRTIIINAPSISEDKRVGEKEIEELKEKLMPSILGGFLDIVSGGLKELPTTKLDEMPSLADFALWVTACEKSLGWESGSFMKVFEKNREIGMNQGIFSDPIALCTIKFMEDKDNWVGTPLEFMNTIQLFDEFIATKNEKSKVDYLSIRDRLRRIKEALKKEGIFFNEDIKRSSKGVRFELKKEIELDSDSVIL